MTNVVSFRYSQAPVSLFALMYIQNSKFSAEIRFLAKSDHISAFPSHLEVI